MTRQPNQVSSLAVPQGLEQFQLDRHRLQALHVDHLLLLIQQGPQQDTVLQQHAELALAPQKKICAAAQLLGRIQCANQVVLRFFWQLAQVIHGLRLPPDGLWLECGGTLVDEAVADCPNGLYRAVKAGVFKQIAQPGDVDIDGSIL